MPISKIKGSAINDDSITTAKIVDDAVTGDKTAHDIHLAGTEAARMPVGTTAERANAASGDIRFNSTLSLMEYYDGTNWKSIDSPPVVSSISPTTETDANANITITGSNFQSGATVKFVGNDGTEYNSPSVTVNSSTEIVATTPASPLTVANEPYDIVVTNASGLAGTGTDLLDAGGVPAWTTAAGNIGTIVEDTAIGSLSIVATDPDGQTVTYSSSDLSITGVTLNSNGTITGTPNADGTYASGGVTHTFTGVASDGTNTASRTFNILRKWADGSTSTQAATSMKHINDLGITTDGTFWIQPSGATSAYQVHGYNSIESGGWELAYRFQTTTNNETPDASGSWGAANWAGWGVTKTQAAVDALSGNGDYSIFADNDAMSPSFVLTPFTDIMVISNRNGQTSKRAGYRFGSTVNNIRDATGGTSAETYTTNVLFGSLQWLQVLDIKSDIASVDTYGGADRFGFKIRSDSGSTTATSNFTGGFWTSTMHYGSQIGVGRENTDGGEWGGGIGGYYGGQGHFKMHGHWWGHGTSWQSGPQDGNVFYGHSVYVRSNAT